MPEYLSPGVYVEEIPSGAHTIAGVGTSTAGFIGIIPQATPGNPTISYRAVAKRKIRTDPSESALLIKHFPRSAGIQIEGQDLSGTWQSYFDASQDPKKGAVNEGVLTVTQVAGGTPRIVAGDPVIVTYTPQFEIEIGEGHAKLCTSFDDFKRSFGDFSTDSGQNRLAHAVYGFFLNGGTRCYVAVMAGNVSPANDVSGLLKHFEAIDDIALVAAPGLVSAANRSAVVSHCENMGDRFAILDCAGPAPPAQHDPGSPPDNSNYAAYYLPWIKVYDPVTAAEIAVPPSGHLAGVYARVDAERGVHKAPANEVIRGALDLTKRLGKADQDGLNKDGINCIRELNGNIRVWGARTIGGDANGEWKYVNVRRLFLYLRESIDEATQWVVFEPNEPALWAQISRNVTAFLTTVWRAGALFGATPEQAFYVKCNAETNSAASIDAW